MKTKSVSEFVCAALAGGSRCDARVPRGARTRGRISRRRPDGPSRRAGRRGVDRLRAVELRTAASGRESALQRLRASPRPIRGRNPVGGCIVSDCQVRANTPNKIAPMSRIKSRQHAERNCANTTANASKIQIRSRVYGIIRRVGRKAMYCDRYDTTSRYLSALCRRNRLGMFEGSSPNHPKDVKRQPPKVQSGIAQKSKTWYNIQALKGDKWIIYLELSIRNWIYDFVP